MTYNELAEYISELSDFQREMDVTILLAGSNEYMPLMINYLEIASAENDVLDYNHPFLTIDF